MTDDLIERADAFRLSIDPTPDDVNEANWLIDRMTAAIEQQAARIADLEAVLESCWSNSQALSEDTWKFHTSLIGSIARAALKQEG